MISLFPLTLGKLFYGKFDIAAQFLGKTEEFQFFRFLGRVAIILLKRHLRGIDRRLRSAQADPDFLIFPGRVIRHVDGEYLRPFLVSQTEQSLYFIELVDIFPLVKENLAVTVVDDGAFDYGRGNDVLHFLSDDHRLAEELPDGFEQILQIFRHAFLADGFPGFFQQYHLADTLQLPHLVDEGFHDDNGHNREQDLVV